MMRTGASGAGDCAKTDAAVNNAMAEKKILFRIVVFPTELLSSPKATVNIGSLRVSP
jgi:hypothetical protein